MRFDGSAVALMDFEAPYSRRYRAMMKLAPLKYSTLQSVERDADPIR